MEIKVTQRSVQGTGASRRLRRQGRVPGIVYGGGAEALAIELDHNEIFHKLRQESFHSSILTMKMDNKTEQALLRNVQMHPFKPIVLHVDFQRVSANEKIHMKVPFHFVNGDTSPAVKLSGAIISHIFNEVEVLCFPQNLPEFIEVDLKDLTVGHSLHLADVKTPDGIEFVAVVKGENPAVVSAILPRAAKAEDDNAPVVSAADVPAANQKAPAGSDK
ncbi:MAG: 50S ribosomal protein L25/general stress protein Ctc [Ferrovum sp. 37-45-19]|uniref:50S ribosomal protein L25/general stress protein Ctc n=1 Tax=Ferrovum sp. JA12 TaxID=1356299 RepID=UPI0007029ADC|nr:50S ribosomal protein L25/general stress protein Ctc [Ferrovum sp. JA12]OYV80543.1 MAG: 50S ribosomal protein L25/general stress protein Ctc [Ferrovum sp. 21-44-67]OYV94858.1 MAG: 50S ribosomal protein L25/general stress protein Ctc [Ferrovum sp. 37-45-19]OZB34109.1 MAG: 50S ribosomal protein L25/general stress protein Ctc [Ferrovum sp. 34-44-207]HQT81009.1 50S ribosomal protein L25/general stress protein Ctc [Ferrovaceae bacterium]KRH79266.1 50S ribosomal protein L25 [Ferrovum sp. JA12]